MVNKRTGLIKAVALRKREKDTKAPKNPEAMSSEEILQMLPELRRQQIELTMQNEELRRAQAEKALLQVQDEWEKTFDAIPDLIALIDNDHRIIRANVAMASRLGCTPAQVIGCHCYEAVHGLSGPPDFCPHTKLLTSGKDGQAEVVEARLGGIFDVSVTPLRNDAGQITGSVHIARDITNRKKAEEMLSLQALVLDQIQDRVTITDLAGVITYVNEAEVASLGYNKEEIIGHSTSVYGEDPKKGARQQEIIDKTIETGSWRGEVVNFTQDGQEVIMDCRTQVVHDGVGLPIALAGIATDVTENKRLEKELLNNRNNLLTVLDAADDIIILTDASGKVLLYNQTVAKRYQHIAADLIGFNIFDLVPEDCRISRRQHFEAARTSTKSIVFEDMTFDRTWSNAIYPVVNNDATVDRMVLFGRDITYRKQVEDALRESEERYRAISESSYSAICIVDERAKIIWVNKEMLTISGYSQEHLYAVESFADFLASESIEFVVSNFYKVLSGEPYEHHYSFYGIRADGEKRLFEKHMMDFKDKSGKLNLIISMIDSTDSKRAEDKLRESEGQYRLLADHMRDYVWLMDMNLKTTFSSPSGQKMRGYTLEEMQALPLDQHLAPASLELAMEVFSEEMPKIMANPNYTAVRKLELEFCRKDGTTFWTENTFSLIRDESGNPQSFLCEGSDITDRKRAEDALRESEDLFRTSMERAPDGIYMNDLDGNFLYGNRKAEEIIGYKREELIGKNFLDFNMIAEGSLGKTAELLQANIEGRSTGPDEIELTRKDGSNILVEITTNVILRDGQTNVLAFVRDITDRKRAEDSLRESEERFRLLFNTIDDAVFLHYGQGPDGLPGNFIEVNDVACNRLGYSRDELLRMRPPDIDTLDTVKATPSTLEKLNREKQATWEGVHVTKDGRLIPVEINNRLIDFQGIPAILSTVRDITDRKLAEDEKSKLKNQLLQSQKMEAVGTLAGGIAHDFNNILGAIIGYTEMAVDEDANEIQKQYLQETLNGAERAKNLIRQILTFSRQDDHDKKPLDIKLLLNEAVKFLRAAIPATIEINQQVTEESCTVLGDPTQMYQVIMNLCTNASHAMTQTGGIIKIELSTLQLSEGGITHHPEIKQGHYIKLTIGDTGHGIDPAHIQRIFDPFFTTKPKNEGTGLGLYVVYGIVKNHGGIINVNSKIAEGSTFSVYLPRIIHEASKTGNISSTTIGGKERILFVDDEPALINVGKRILSSLGYEVTGVTGSVEALDLFLAEPQRFDLVITDMTLPKMTGIVLSRKILKIRPDIPIIICSGIRERSTEEQAKSLGIRAYIMKPLTKRELARVIRDTLDGNLQVISQ